MNVHHKSPSCTIMAEASKRCQNPGCQKDYLETENSDTACRYHPGKPIFHDVKKGWACCARVVYDWDEFARIEGCETGRHSDVKRSTEFQASQIVDTAQRALDRDVRNRPIRNIEDYDREEEEKQKRLKEAAEARPQIPDVTPDGKYKCANFGCNQPYDPADNSEDSCHYHTSGPMFHDVKKFWTCCNATSWDWDDFQRLPTCSVGVHRPKYKK